MSANHIISPDSMRRTTLLLLSLAACGTGANARTSESDSARPANSATAPAGRDSTAIPTSATPSAPASVVIPETNSADTAIIRGLYVNRFAAQSTKRMRALTAMADSTEINGMVIDVKDEFGLNIPVDDPALQKNAGKSGVIPNVRALLDTLKAHGVLPIARIVVFKDSVAARANPAHVIRKADGSAWRDKEGLTWVNPYDEEIWEYNIRVAEEAVKLGFGEIQFDYIRFPEPYKSLPKQVFPNEKGRKKYEVLAQFLKTADERLNALGVRTTADVFGLVTTINGPLEIGQEWESMASVTDVLLPMTYPSHYPRGAFGIDRPNADPYKVQLTANRRARERNEKLGLKGERVRPWIQAFSLGQPKYGAHEVKEQLRGVYDAGFEGWVLWHPGSKYEEFLPALERKGKR